ncbi:MAG: substrate-binding domain-containing protein [Deltaproteobacteria bacterium]|nr:substrate-binding domain-containing protein [Deltaproteobacteria bacterium]
MELRKSMVILLFVGLAVVLSLGSASAEQPTVDPFTNLSMFSSDNYIKVRAAKGTEVDLNPAMQSERINTPMTPSWKPKPPPWRIGWSDITVHNPWRMVVTWEGKLEAEKYPKLIKELIQVEAGGDINKQISDCENLLAKGVDVLIISPGSPSALVPVIEKAYEKGVPVIVFHGRVNTEKFTCSIQPDEYGFGWLFGDWLGKQLNGKGKVIGFKALPGYKPAIDRWQGAVDGLAQYPGVKMLGAEFAHWSPVKGRQAATNLLAAHPSFDGILSIDPWALAACIELMAAAGRPMVAATGFEENSSFRMWIEYDITGIGANEPTWLAAEAIKIAIKVMQGQPIYKRYLTQVPVVHREDLDKVYRPDMPDSYYPGSHLPDKVLREIFK